jgi:hypothetical protein
MYYRIYRQSDDFHVIEGVRYKKGSVKIIEQEGSYVVILKRYLIKRITYSVKRFEFSELQDAEIKYETLKNHLWRIS